MASSSEGLGKVTIYGQNVHLEPPAEGAYVTDVIVIARAVFPGDDGRMKDNLIMRSSDTTTGMIQRAMVDTVQEALSLEGLFSFEDSEEDEDD